MRAASTHSMWRQPSSGRSASLALSCRAGVPDHGFGAARALRDLERARGLHQPQRPARAPRRRCRIRMPKRSAGARSTCRSSRTASQRLAPCRPSSAGLGDVVHPQVGVQRGGEGPGRAAGVVHRQAHAQRVRRQRHRAAGRGRHAARRRAWHRRRAAAAPGVTGLAPSAGASGCQARLRAKPCLGRARAG